MGSEPTGPTDIKALQRQIAGLQQKLTAAQRAGVAYGDPDRINELISLPSHKFDLSISMPSRPRWRPAKPVGCHLNLRLNLALRQAEAREFAESLRGGVGTRKVPAPIPTNTAKSSRLKINSDQRFPTSFSSRGLGITP